MLVHFVTDEPNKIPAIRAMLEPQHAVASHVLGAAGMQVISNGVLVVDADLRKAVPVGPAQGDPARYPVRFREAVRRSEPRPRYGCSGVRARRHRRALPARGRSSQGSPSSNSRRSRCRPILPSPPHEVVRSAASFTSLFLAIGSGKQITLRMPRMRRRKSSTASRGTVSTRGLTMCAATTKARSSTACW